MEPSETFRDTASSLRGIDSFSRSSRNSERGDDEEALKWAALEKLPTYNRVRRGILETEAEEVDVQNLGLRERKGLLDRLVRVAEEDNERFLNKLKNRMDLYEYSLFFFLSFFLGLILLQCLITGFSLLSLLF